VRNKKRIIIVAGARPNFMKVAPIYRELNKRSEYFEPLLVHTGQHYDANMSDAFLKDLEMPKPDIFLGIGSGSHAEQTAGVMVSFERSCKQHAPDLVIVVGDVNSTMSCAITAAKSNIAVGHVEAGLRSHDRTMPEEINRLVTDCISDLLFTPSADADENLLREGISPEKIYRVGNIMIDSLEFILPKVNGAGTCSCFGLVPKDYGLITLHRPSNVDSKEVLKQIVDVLIKTAESLRIAFPVHPRTRKNLEKFGLLTPLEDAKNIIILEPLGYIDFMNLLVNTKFVLTDSGGLQEETTYLGIPCLTLRPNTERPVTINEGTNELVTIKDLYSKISDAYDGSWKKGKIPELWDGMTASRIAEIIKKL
jgi:UDP-N-acetylglucosamine 2-epimerase (non-hydrolysing)